ncbi:MAG: peptidase C45 [Candidatus Hydrogenedentes bacterium]|nr:peptidase C45 [Candidatus Hydrogenedentota bacterium]
MKRFGTIFTLCIILAIAGCGKSAPVAAPDGAVTKGTPEQTSPPAPAAEPASPPAQANVNTSQTAAKTEAALSAEPAAERTLPAGHWLEGTSKELDMLDAIIAPAAPRKLLAESGPAYLEQIGLARVLHLKGTHYEMGKQHGTLMKEEILAAANLIKTIGAFEWKENYQVSIREAWTRTSPFIPDKYKDEIRGMAEAIGLTEEDVQNFTIFPELFHCSGFAVWGKATEDGSLLHGRVLDYMRDAGLDKWALVIIQEPEGANAFVNVGYSGTIGSVTGMNMQHVAIGEMGGRGEGQWDGMPMTLLLRECLESANTLDDAQRIMSESKRTCEYYYVISDSKANNGRGDAVGVAATPEQIQFIHANEFNERLPRPVEDAVLLSADDRYNCLADRVQKMYGKINPQVGMDIMARGVAMKSNMHNALFKPATLEMWVANSTVKEPACNLPYTYFNLKELQEQRPSAQ